MEKLKNGQGSFKNKDKYCLIKTIFVNVVKKINFGIGLLSSFGSEAQSLIALK